jgi:hypothetical protein
VGHLAKARDAGWDIGGTSALKALPRRSLQIVGNQRQRWDATEKWVSRSPRSGTVPAPLGHLSRRVATVFSEVRVHLGSPLRGLMRRRVEQREHVRDPTDGHPSH